MKKHLFLILLLLVSMVKSQVVKVDSTRNLQISSLPYYNFGKGLGLTSPDSIFQLNIRFRMQNRVSYIHEEEADHPVIDGQIRRLRLRFDGYVGNPKFIYAIQLSFAPGDVGEIEDGENLNIIRDAVVFYRPNKYWNIGFGQTKLPGNRQRVNSSGALELSDRSINNASFNIDRDFGFQLHYTHENLNKFAYNFRGAVTMGEGRNWTDNNDDGLSLTGKAEFYPLGNFTKDGAYFEGDLKREPKPKLMISGAYNQNNWAKLTMGQLGDKLYAPRTTKSILLDAMFKYQGWSIMGDYMSRDAKNPVTYNPDDVSQFNYVVVGKGYDFQASYTTPKFWSFIG